MQERSARGVQQHEVDAAADALLAQRLRPTVERVRMKIGRGSPNTVAPMLEAWFAGLAPRLGVAVVGGDGQGVPPVVRQALDTVWSAALAAAVEQAAQALVQDREALADDRRELAQAREALVAQQAALADREAALQESLVLARGQLAEASQRAAQLQARLERAEADVAAGRQALADLVQQHAGERRAHAEQLRTQAGDLQRAQELAASAERRLLADVDRARQEAKEARRELIDAQRTHEKDHKELAQANQTLGSRYQGAQIEIASLRERLAAAENRAADLQAVLDAQRATAGESGPGQGKPVIAKKARAGPQPGKRAGAGARSGAAPRVNRGRR
jgi:hypothetical protein